MRLIRISRIVISLILVLLHIAPLYASSPWPMFMHDSRHTGRSDYSIPDKVDLLWASDFAMQEITGISISNDGGTIYAGSKDHNIYAIAASDGSVTWEYITEHEIVGTPAVDEDGYIYVCSKDDHLYCLNSDGTLNWKYEMMSDPIGSPAIGPLNMIIVSTVDRMYAVWEGVSLWTDSSDLLDGRIYSAWNAGPAIGSDGTIYNPGSSNVVGGDFHAIDLDGNSKWSLVLGGSVGSSNITIGDNGLVYIPSRQGIGLSYALITAINTDGTISWEFSLQDKTYLSNPATGPDGTIYIGCNDCFLYAINQDGTLKWRYLMSSSMMGASFAVDANGNVLTVSQLANAPLVALDSTGSLKWKVYPDYAFVNQTPIIGLDGDIYIPNEEGIVAITEGDNTEITVGQSSVDEESVSDDGDDDGGGGCFIKIINRLK